jgi:palmitoyltransferase
MKEHVKDVKLVCIVFYFSCHLFGILLLGFGSNALVGFSGFNVTFWVLKGVTCFLFTVAGNNPGTPSQICITQELQELDWQIPAYHYCEICKIQQPYRTRHCEDCEICISKFDHHCFWLGSCVGELNHFKFTLYLTLESYSLWTIFFYCFTEDSSWKLAGYLFLGLTCFGFGILCIGLAGFHIYLISIGTTTWEIMRRKSISYLKPFPYNFHPFSKGFFANWVDAILSRNTKNWILPRPMNVYPFNWCENEYWSCC